MRRYTGGNIGGRNKPGSGVYSMGQQLNEKVDGNWVSTGTTYAPDKPSTISITEWTRNPSWLPLPTVTSSDEKFVALMAISGPKEYLALTATGNYTVDWGDGTVENFSSGAKATHIYDFTDGDLNNTNAPVTLTASDSTVNRTAHGYSNGDIVTLNNIVTTTGIVAGVSYFVVNKTDNSFQIANGPNGTPITFTGNGSATLLPYKQAVLIITPQAGQQLTTLDFNSTHPSLNRVPNRTWLDVVVSGPNFNSTGMTNISGSLMERIRILNLGGQTSMSYMFFGCDALRTYEISNIPNVTNYSYMFTNGLLDGGAASLQEAKPFPINANANCFCMFAGCPSLTKIGNFDFSNVVNGSGMFSRCERLSIFPEVMNFTNCTDFSYALSETNFPKVPKVIFGKPWDGSGLFYYSAIRKIESGEFDFSLCTKIESLFDTTHYLESVEIDDLSSVVSQGGGSVFDDSAVKYVKLGNLSSLQDCSYLFYNAQWLEEVEITAKTSAATTFAYMFYGGGNNYAPPLKKVTIFEGTPLPYLTTCTWMFAYCYDLEEVNAFDTSNVTNMRTMFYECRSLKTAPAFNTSNVTDMGDSMFAGCSSLIKVPDYDTSKVTDMSYMFVDCMLLEEPPAFNTANVTNMSGMFQGCYSLRTFPNYDFSKITNFSSIFMTFSSIEEVPDLYFPVSSRIGGLFYECRKLKKVGKIDAPLATDIGNMFYNCSALEYVPSINTAPGDITAVQTFYGCTSLKTVPDFDPAKNRITQSRNMFFGCKSLTKIPRMNVSTIADNYTHISLAGSNYNLSNVGVTNLAETVDYTNSNLQKDDLEFVFANLANTSGKTVTVTGTPGIISLASIVPASGNLGSNTLTTSDTTALYVGAPISGNGLTEVLTATYIAYTNPTVFTCVNHGMANGTVITSISPAQPFDYNSYTYVITGYVRDATQNTFTLSTRSNLSGVVSYYYGSGTQTFVRKSTVTGVTANTSFNVSVGLTRTVTNDSYSVLGRAIGNVSARGWTVAY